MLFFFVCVCGHVKIRFSDALHSDDYDFRKLVAHPSHPLFNYCHVNRSLAPNGYSQFRATYVELKQEMRKSHLVNPSPFRQERS